MSSSKPNAQELLKRFASTISQQPMGLVAHVAEPWAQPMQCLQNVVHKIQRDGGRAIFGWAFLDRRSPQYGDYLIATHHAVWCASGSTVGVDVTPFHENPRHRPYSPGGSVLFLLDDAAQPKAMVTHSPRLLRGFFRLPMTLSWRHMSMS
jgi:hypothetical protein